MWKKEQQFSILVLWGSPLLLFRRLLYVLLKGGLMNVFKYGREGYFVDSYPPAKNENKFVLHGHFLMYVQ